MLGGSMSFGPTSIAAFILFIGILIFVHELGHFLAAKYFGIKVLKFSLGFGPPIFRFTKGETTYQIALLPLGGYVKMLGESPMDEVAPEERSRAFNAVPVYQRALVAFAGPLFNLVFPVICFFAYYVLGPTVMAPVIGQIEIGTPAEKAGLKNGDRVLSIDGERVWDFDRMASLVRERAGESLRFKIERGNTVQELDVVPREVRDEDVFGSPRPRGIIGVSPARLGTRVGVDSSLAAELGFKTGDRILSIAGAPVTRLPEVDLAIANNAGKKIAIEVARPTPMTAGGLFFAVLEEPKRLEVSLPAGILGMSDLGLLPSETFLRALAPGGAAARAGLRAGDRVVEVAGTPVSLFYSFVTALQQAEDKPVEVKVRREGKTLDFTVKNDKRELLHEVTGKMRPYYDHGIGLGDIPRSAQTLHWYSGGGYQTEKARLTLGEALVVSVQQTLNVIAGISVALFKLFAGDISLKTVGGPIMLFQVAAEAAEIGLFRYLELLALISVNLGLVNLLPVPVFDGGHLLFCAIEAIKRKPVSLRVREAATIVGLVLLAALIVLVFSNDFSRTFK